MMYNYPEGSDLPADKESFVSLCSTVFDINMEIDKVLRLGRRLEGKHRPLLIRLNSESDKHTILSQAPRLRFHEQYKMFISHDMTQSEHVKHKALVQELHSRRAKGERNLMIRNGNIIVRYSSVVSKEPDSNIATLASASNCS